MDSGYLAQGETLEDDYDVLRELLPEEVVGIMDQMLCYEVCTHPLPRQEVGTFLMLIVGILDGMAHGPFTFPDPFHVILHRPSSVARTKDIRPSPLLSREQTRR